MSISFLFRFFKQFLLIFVIQQMAAGIFRLTAGVCRTMIIANTGGALTLLLVFLLGGFILPKGKQQHCTCVHRPCYVIKYKAKLKLSCPVLQVRSRTGGDGDTGFRPSPTDTTPWP